METLKNGCKGEDVKTLQKLLGLTPDGVFGPNTQKAVKEYQKNNGLYDDGVVGPKTWAKLMTQQPIKIPSGNIQLSSDKVKIEKMPLSVHIEKLPNRTIKYISIHFTAGSSSKSGRAAACKKVFESRNASADFAVDDTTICQFNPDIRNYYCWAVGDKKNKYSSGGSLYGIATNKNTISIELCSTCKPATSVSVSYANHNGWSFTNEVFNNGVKLVKYLMKTYNIPIERVVRHYDISGKLCPGIPGWNKETLYTIDGKKTSFKSNEHEWFRFKDALQS